MFEEAGGTAIQLMGSILGQTARGMKDNTTLSIDVNAGVVTTSFSADETKVSASPAIGLNIVATATYTSPKAGSGPSASVGGLVGEGLVGGGTVDVGKDGVRGGSLSAGVGIQLPAAVSKVMKLLGLISVPIADQKNH